MCSGKLQITTRFGPNAATHPTIQVTGSTYTVYFSSGFWMRAETSSYYMNVYVQVPGAAGKWFCLANPDGSVQGTEFREEAAAEAATDPAAPPRVPVTSPRRSSTRTSSCARRAHPPGRCRPR